MVKINRLTRQRVVCDPHSGDIEFLSQQGNNTIDNETIKVIGKWTEPKHDGAGGTNTGGKKGSMRFPAANSFQGTDIGLEGGEFPNINAIGQTSDNKRRRRKLLKMECKTNNY